MISLSPSVDFDQLEASLDRLARMDQYAMDLSSRLQLVLLEDNRVGVLNGTDGYSSKLAPTKYRYSGSGVNPLGKNGITQRKQAASGRSFFFFSEIPRDHHSYAAQVNLGAQTMPMMYGGAMAVGSYKSNFYEPSPKNSDYDLYRGMDGPPTAPNWEQSRVIANYVSHDVGSRGPSVQVSSQWEGVTNERGEAFLTNLFYGQGRIPPRDLTGLRYWGRHNAEVQTGYFLQDLDEGILA
jgi:hypothetical protein